jgi:hypothetical protein
MENFLFYLAKATALTSVFYLAYYTLLKKETFFTGNRHFLLAGLFTSVLLPLLVFKKVIWVDPAPQELTQTIDLGTLVKMQQIMVQEQPETFTISWPDVLGGMYLAGFLLFLTKFLMDLRSIRRILKGNIIVKDGRFKLIDTNKVQSPFSFFNYIVYNSAVLEPDELQTIISHEKVHSAQRHSLDMIISQLFCVVFWFNPFVWLYKKSVSQNLEFIADDETTKALEDSKAYQKTLLKITVQPECIAITNHFYQSLIKKRIVMLNKQKSNKMNSWKYAVVLPALAAFLVLFQVKVVAQEKAPAKTTFSEEKTKISVEITKDASDEQLAEETKVFKEEFDADVTFSKVTRNATSEITGIRVDVKDKNQSKVYEISGNEPIAPFTIEMEKGFENGMNSIVFGGGSGDFMISADRIHYTDRIAADTLLFDRKAPIMAYGYADGMHNPAPPVMPFPSRGGNVMLSSGDELVVIDGVKQKKSEQIVLPGSTEIASITILDSKEAKKKYGREAKEGAVEITTRKVPGGRMKIMGPGSYSIDVPDYGESFSYNIEIPEIDFAFPEFSDMQIEEFPDLKVFEDMGEVRMKILSDGEMTDEERKMMREQLENVRKQLEGSKEQREMHMRLLNSDELKREMEEMRKELEKSRKAIEESRKDLEKSRREMNKKSY